MKPESIPRIFSRRLTLFLLLLFGAPLLSAAPNVVVSIKPIHSLVAGVMQNVGQPDLLVTGGQSPHNFSLKPSDMRLLQQADLIVWVGPDVESSLSGLLEKSTLHSRLLTLIHLHDLHGLPPRDGAEWEARRLKRPEMPEHDHSHGGDIDSHIWLSPEIALGIVQRVTQLLSDMDPANAPSYRENSRQLAERLYRLDEELAHRLSPVRQVPFIVFHDAYHYFEHHYELNAVGSVSVSPQRQPGLRHIHDLRSKIIRLQARCIFSEPQFRPKLVQTLVDGTDAKAGELDPLGSDIEPGPDAYFLLMRRLGEQMYECLH